MAKSKGNSALNTRLFLISIVLVIAIGGMTLFVCTAVFSSSEKDVSLFKRAAYYIKDNVQSTIKSSMDGLKKTFAREQRSVPDEFPWKDIRLPKTVSPYEYDLYLKPNLEEPFVFTGRVSINIHCLDSTNQVILHFKKLDIKSFELLDSKKKYLNVSKILKNEEHEQILLEAQDELKSGKNYTLKLTFAGTLSNKMAGFYRSSYKTKEGETRYLATTQFESTDARAAFPCFDEPEFKAKFNITMAHKKQFHAISNMPMDKQVETDDTDLIESRFLPSVKMSTYLVAFIVSDFEYTETTTKDNTKVRVWASKDNVPHTRFALAAAENVLSYYEKFFEIPYPLPKIDLVAVPDFAAGAMENWGLMTFRETYLLSNQASSSAADKQDVAIVVAHELAHQWFGNLVTMKWWNDLWLNEGFANYVEYIGTDHYAKEWRVLDQFVTDTHQTALQVDSMKNTHPISVPVTNPSEITEIFDVISYNKGSSVIRMLRGFLGDAAFKKGLKHYLEKHQYANAEADDLWNSLSEVSPGLNVKAIMDTWIKQEGYPVISIKDSQSSVRSPHKATKLVQQNRFFRDASPPSQQFQDEMNGTSYNWIVPLTYITADNPESPITIWMNRSSASLHLPHNSKWVKANVDQMGYYRVNYDGKNWANLAQQLDDDHSVFSPTDRSGLLDDSFNLARAGYMELKTALEFNNYLNKEKDYIPWATAMRNLGFIGSMFSMKPAYSNYEKYMTAKLKPLESYVGWQNEGDVLKMYLRSNVLSSLANHDDSEVVAICMNGFHQMMTNESYTIGTHIRGLVYHAAIKYGGVAEWEYLWDKYKASIDPTEKSRMLHALSGTRETALQARFLENTLDKEKIRAQDMTSALAGIASHSYGRLITWDFFRENFKTIIDRVGRDPMEIGYMLTAVTRSFNDEFHLAQVEQFVEENKEILESLRATKKVLEGLKSNIAWMKANEQKVEEWLEEKVSEFKI